MRFGHRGSVLLQNRRHFWMLFPEPTGLLGFLLRSRVIPITRLYALDFEQSEKLPSSLPPITLEEMGFPTLVGRRMRALCRNAARTLLASHPGVARLHEGQTFRHADPPYCGYLGEFSLLELIVASEK